MKINKLIVSFFVSIGFLIQVYGAEDSGDRDLNLQRIHNIKSQISSLQEKLYEFEQPLNRQEYPDHNAINIYPSANQTADMDNVDCDDILMDDPNTSHSCKLVKYACAAITISVLANMAFMKLCVCCGCACSLW